MQAHKKSARSGSVATLPLVLALGLCWPAAGRGQGVTTSDLETAAGNTSEWLMYGRDYRAHRFVELDQITPDNVDRLDPVWVFAAAERTGVSKPPLSCTKA